MDELISVIIPVYNVKEYLSECIESLINQTYPYFEIILVDDGSTDGSQFICDEYSSNYEFIRVLHKENGGLSDARNKGLQYALGDFVIFVDSDDYVSPDFVEALAKGFNNESVDITCCCYQKFNDGESPLKKVENERILFMNSTQAMRFCYSKAGRNVDIVAWNKMYRKCLFLNYSIEYPYHKFFEDLYTTFKLFYYARNIVIDMRPLYYYRQRRGSIMSTPMTKKKYNDALEGLKASLSFYKANESVMLFSNAYSMYCRMMIKLYRSTKKMGQEKRAVQLLLLNDYRNIYKENTKNVHINFLKKIVFALFYFFPNLVSNMIK